MSDFHRVYITTEVYEKGQWINTIKQSMLELWNTAPDSFIEFYARIDRKYEGELYDDSGEWNLITHDAFGEPLRCISLSEFLLYLEENPSLESPSLDAMCLLETVAKFYDKATNNELTYLVLHSS